MSSQVAVRERWSSPDPSPVVEDSKASTDLKGPTDSARAQAAELSGASFRSSSPPQAQSAELTGVIQRRARSALDGPGAIAAPVGRIDALVSDVTRDPTGKVPYQREMEARFGTAFDGVQAYAGTAASDACDRLDAEAFTVGNRIAFRTANPDKETVAHELAHVVQQGGGAAVQTRLTVGRADDRHEREADAAAGRVAKGLPVAPADLTPVSSAVVSRKRKNLPKEFEKLWEAHPHNYQDDESENTSSRDVNKEAGWDPDQYENTCAIRLSVMFNKLGGEYRITRKRAVQAGIKGSRVVYSSKTKFYYILSAKEMWTYVSFWFGKPDKQFPSAKRRYKTEEEFTKDWDAEIKEYVSSRKGIVAFDKIFGYSGTGHVDIFDGESLSDAPNWYPCKNLKLWFV